MQAPLRIRQRPDLPSLKVGFVLSPSFTLTPLAGFVDAIRLAADHEDDSRQIHFQWSFLHAKEEIVRSSCGLEVVTNESFGDPAQFDCIVVVGGLMKDNHMHAPQTFDYLRRAFEKGVQLIALCTGSFVLAQAGLLRSKRCSVHFGMLKNFSEQYPDSIPVTDVNYVVEEGIITCPGSIAAIDLAAYLIKFSSSESRARKALNYLLFEQDKPRIRLPKRPYEDKLLAADRITNETVRMMETMIETPCSIDELAARTNCSKDQINRSFRKHLRTSPAKFWRDIRLQMACDLLASNSKTVTEIAYETGFADTAHFCRIFRDKYKVSPQTYRKAR